MLPLTRSRNRARFFGIPFSPSVLFAGGTVAGAWYDPSDLSTMFDSSTGTTPVAMPGQGAAVPVGLMLDKSQGLVLGANVLGSVWSTLGGAVASGSSVTFNSVSDIAAFQSVMTAGVRYLVSFDYNITSGQAGLYVGTNGGTGAAIIDLSGLSGTGSFSGYFIAGTALFIFRDLSGCVASFTNITLRAQLGNHAIAFNNTTARPELRARVNLLTYSEDFSNAAWGTGAGGGASISKGTTTGVRPDGTTGTVHTLTFSAVSAGQFAIAFQAAAQAFLNVQLTASLYVRVASGTATIYLNLEDSGTAPTGTNFVAGSAQTVTTSWQRISLTGTRATAPNNVSVVIGFDTRAAAGQTNAAPVTIEVWGADLRPANIGANVPAYQRIADANTYDTSGFPLYLRFDGIDDSMYTPANLNLSGTDKVAVFAGVRKNADVSIVAELSANASSNNGAFLLATGGWATENGTYVRSSRGTATSFAQPATNSYPSPRTDVLTGTSDIAGDSVVLRISGTQAATSATDQGTGNFGTYPLYIGARNNSSLWLNGHLHGLIIAGSAVSAGNISATEQWVAGKTGIVIP